MSELYEPVTTEIEISVGKIKVRDFDQIYAPSTERSPSKPINFGSTSIEEFVLATARALSAWLRWQAPRVKKGRGQRRNRRNTR